LEFAETVSEIGARQGLGTGLGTGPDTESGIKSSEDDVLVPENHVIEQANGSHGDKVPSGFCRKYLGDETGFEAGGGFAVCGKKRVNM
jgi:hypothetical protein